MSPSPTLSTRDGEVVGAVGFDVATSAPVKIKCAAVDPLHRRHDQDVPAHHLVQQSRRRRASASRCAPARGVIDIEFLQFYPNGHLAPRMVGLDPTTWEPTRVKLGGRLLNGNGEEFLHRYGEADGDGYDTARDTLTYRDLQGGRGRPRVAAWRRLSVVPAHRRGRSSGHALGPVPSRFSSATISISLDSRSRSSRSPTIRWAGRGEYRHGVLRSGPLRGGGACRRRQRRQSPVRKRVAGGPGIRRTRRGRRRARLASRSKPAMGRRGRRPAYRLHP